MTYGYNTVGDLIQTRTEQLGEPSLVEATTFNEIGKVITQAESGHSPIQYWYDANGVRLRERVQNSATEDVCAE